MSEVPAYGTGVSKLKVPAGACDTHMHFYGPESRYPMIPGNANKPGLFTVPDYRAIQQRVGLERVVVVQAAAYGTDNTCVLDAIADLGDGARGVATVDKTVSDADMQTLTDAGIRGARIFMLPGGILPWEDLVEITERVQNFGWHVIVQFDGREFAERLPLLEKMPGNLIIDHTGKFLEPVPIDHPAFKALLKLVDSGRCWVKLSAPYETSKGSPPYYDDVAAMGRALAKTVPERMLWASNWPHPGVAKMEDKPDESMLLNTLLHWVEDDALWRRILVDNPAELYGF